MVKSALYKHYKSKQDILDSIVQRMSEMDSKNAIEHEMPEGEHQEMPEVYQHTQVDSIQSFTEAMFIHWTQEEFSVLFRKMITIEQYRNEDMSRLYEQYLSSGPLAYVEDLFAEITGDKENAKLLAVRYYAPMYMMYSLYDEVKDKDAVNQMFTKHTQQFIADIKQKYRLE